LDHYFFFMGTPICFQKAFHKNTQLIIQSWRSNAFKAEDPDSTLILSFTPVGDAGRIDLIHLDVPDHDYDGVTQGWENYYWAPWRAYLATYAAQR